MKTQFCFYLIFYMWTPPCSPINANSSPKGTLAPQPTCRRPRPFIYWDGWVSHSSVIAHKPQPPTSRPFSTVCLNLNVFFTVLSPDLQGYIQHLSKRLHYYKHLATAINVGNQSLWSARKINDLLASFEKVRNTESNMMEHWKMS